MSGAEVTRHKEAFALMWYGCKCGHRERIWNSRDGVTPFGCQCPSCGKPNLQHVDWRADQPAPAHLPHRGQRVWRDGTIDEAVEIMTKRIGVMRAGGHEISPEEAGELIQSVRSGDGGFQPGWPNLVVVIETGIVP